MRALACTARLATACDGVDVFPVAVISGRRERHTRACRACRQYADRAGLVLVDERPEWRRRAAAHALPTKDLSGAL